jgi:hypothetical protein
MGSIVEKIPTVKTRDTLQLWRNAVDVLGDGKKSNQHVLAAKVIGAIRVEWERRSKQAFDPNDVFPWPSTTADGGSGNLSTEDWTEEGVFSCLGYRVGVTNGRPSNVRERILSEIFDGPLPPVFMSGYLAEWGRPASSGRLRKMAETIAALTRNARRRRDDKLRAAIRDWQQDLGFLHDEYYVGKFHFAWPMASI